jgi:hypothetical protein
MLVIGEIAMGKYSKSLSTRLRNRYSHKPFQRVSQNDLFDVTKRHQDPDIIDFFEYFKTKEHWSNGTYYAILDKDCDSKHFVGSHLFGHRIWYLRIGRIDSIFRADGEPIHNWSVLQGIKNEIVGPEYEAVELYPAQSRLMNLECCYHLWILAPEKAEPTPPRFSIGYKREITTRVLVRKTDFEKMSLRRRKETSENRTCILVPEELIAYAEEEFPEQVGMAAACKYINAHPEIGAVLETWCGG